jgi:hypothetical protein
MSTDATLALSELRALVTKAARGAGLAWGLAEEAGWAADWLARRGLPAADWATLWLQTSVQGQPGPVESGAGLADRLASAGPALTPEALADDLCAPGYLLPFLHRIAQHRGAVALRAPLGLAAEVSGAGDVVFGPGWASATRGWRLVPADTPRPTGRPIVTASVIDCLEGLALRTTVPPSTQSRRDAGSASDDTD